MTKQVQKKEAEQNWELFGLQADFCKALAHPTRQAIIYQLKNEGEVSVNRLSEQLGVRQTNISQHLAILRDAGVVTTKRVGPNIIYSISDERVVQACGLVRKALEERVSKRNRLFK